MIGTVIGNYCVTEQIGAGGMGIVYRAEHVLLGKSAAIKVLRPERCESQEIVERFFNEARAASMIKHPGIPEIFDYGKLESGNAYLVMEMLEGKTLGQVLKDNLRISPGRSVALTRLMAGTLKATHEQGIIHRDLKPDNVFVVPDAAMPRGERIKILDFGIAKLQGDHLANGVETEVGRLMGTPYYMSPEQCRGAGSIDHRTDIYSLGCVLYQMLCGRPPFSMKGSGEVLAAHIHIAPEPVCQVETSIPGELSKLTMRLLDKDPDKRFQTMESVMAALNSIATYTEMNTPEPSLATSKDMNIALYEDTDGTSGDGKTLRSSTTLGSSSGEFSVSSPKETWSIGGHRPSAMRQVLTPLVLVLGLGFAAWGAWTALDNKAEEDLQPALVRGQGAAVRAQTPPPVTAPETPIIVREIVEVPVETVSLTIESEPAGAKIYRDSDGVEVGRTPMTLNVRKGRGKIGFLLKKSGYRSVNINLPVSIDGKSRQTLRRNRKKHKSNERNLPEGAATKDLPAPAAPPKGAPQVDPSQ